MISTAPAWRANRLRGIAVAAVACVSSLACTSIPAGRASVDAVDFEGVEKISESDLASKMATTPTPKFVVFRGIMYDYEIFDPYVLAQDLERVERYYRAHGYYEAHARAARVEYVSANHVRVRVAVDEGPPVLVKEIRVEGASDLPPSMQRTLARAVQLSGLRVGARFEEDDFGGGEWHLLHALEDHAYAYAKVEKKAFVDLPNHAVTVTYTLTPDKPATIGKITFKGLDALPEAPVLRALDLHEGEPYSAADVDAAQQAVLNLGVFSAVNITAERPDPPPEDHVVPVTVTVTPTKLRSVQVGGGIELDTIKTDLHARVGWTDRNFMGGLRKFDVNFQPGFVLYPTRLPDFQAPDRLLPEERLRVEIRQPGFIEARTEGYVRGDFNVYPLLLTPDVDPNAAVVGYAESHGAVGLERTFWKLHTNLSYNVQYEYPFAYIPSRPIDPDLHSVVLSYVDLQTNFDFRDDRVRPHKGIYLGNEVQFAGIGGDAIDFRIQPQVRAYIPVRHSTVALRATTGLLFPANYGSTLGSANPSDRDLQLIYFRGFFSGGASSNRGYPIWGVGPHGKVPFLTPALATQAAENECEPGTGTYDPARCALPEGGQTLWEASAEFRLPVTDSFEEVTFCDSSDVESGEATYKFDARRLHVSCGIGLRYGTPAGPIRLDLALRIPGLNPYPTDSYYDYPGDILGVPLGIAFGIGEAY
jgi:outer membrane protein assembly factor BamA